MNHVMSLAYAVSTCLGCGIIIGLFVYYMSHRDRVLFAYILFLLSVTLTDLLHFISMYFELAATNTIAVVSVTSRRIVPDVFWFRFIKTTAGSSFIATLPFFINRFLLPDKKLKAVNTAFLCVFMGLIVLDFHLYFTNLAANTLFVIMRNVLWSAAVSAAILYAFIVFVLLNKRIIIREIRYFFLVVTIVSSVVIPLFILHNVLHVSVFAGIIPFSFDIRPFFFILWYVFNIVYFSRYLLRLSQQKQFSLPTDGDLNAYGLTKREKQVLLLLLRGQSYNAMCEELFISLPTVKSHVYSIYKKTKTKNRMSLLRFFQNECGTKSEG